MVRLWLSLIAALTLALVAAVPVGAAKPLMERFADQGSGPDPGLTDACDAPITSEWTVRGTFIEYADGSVRIQTTFHATFRGDGGVAYERSAWMIHGTPAVVVVDEEAGTETVAFTDRYTGLPVKWSIPGSGLIVRDAGQVTFDVTLVFDLETGDLLSVQQKVIDVHGPHPFIEGDYLDDLCAALI